MGCLFFMDTQYPDLRDLPFLSHVLLFLASYHVSVLCYSLPVFSLLPSMKRQWLLCMLYSYFHVLLFPCTTASVSKYFKYFSLHVVCHCTSKGPKLPFPSLFPYMYLSSSFLLSLPVFPFLFPFSPVIKIL